MHYITSVLDKDKNVKHIIEINGNNVEVMFMLQADGYGNKSNESYYIYGDVLVYKDYTFRLKKYDSVHLAKVVVAIEIARFIEEKLNENSNTSDS